MRAAFHALDRRRAVAGSPFAAIAPAAERMALRMVPGILDKEPHTPEFDPERALREGMKANAIVYRCITGKADRCASVPWRMYELTDAGKGKIVDDDPIARLVEFPHRDGAFGRQTLIYRTAMYLEGSGVGLIRKVGGGIRSRLLGSNAAPAEELHPESPVGIRPIPDPVRFISGYEYEDAAKQGALPRWDGDEIIHIRYEDPLDPYWGLSRLQALARTVDVLGESERLRLRRTTNDGRPSVVIIDPAVTTKEQREQAEGDLFRRRDTLRGGWMVVGGGSAQDGKPTVQLHELGLSNVDLEMVSSMAFDRDLIAIAFGYLPAGFSNDAATYSNSEIFVRHEWSLAQAVNRVIAEALTRRLVPREQWGKRWLSPDYSDVEELQEDKPKRATALKDLRDAGVALNDAIQYLDMEIGEQIGGDEPIVPGNYMPVRHLVEEVPPGGGRL